MPEAPAIPTGGSRFAAGLSIFYAALFGVSGAYMPFFPVWLQAVGLEPAMIGLIVAAPTVARLLAVPIITAAAGRHDALRGAIICTAALTLVGMLLLGSMRSALAIAVVLWLVAWPWTAVVPLTDAYALRGVAYHRRAYGPIRLWGSVGYIAAALAAGFLGSWLGALNLIWVIAGFAGLAALTSFWLTPAGAAAPGALQISAPAELLRTPAFLAVLIAAALIQGSHAAYYIFSAISWQAAGMSSTTVSLLWALCVGCRDCAVCGLTAARSVTGRPDRDRRGRIGGALDRHGPGTATSGAGRGPGAARAVVRRDASRRHGIARATGAWPHHGERARLCREPQAASSWHRPGSPAAGRMAASASRSTMA